MTDELKKVRFISGSGDSNLAASAAERFNLEADKAQVNWEALIEESERAPDLVILLYDAEGPGPGPASFSCPVDKWDLKGHSEEAALALIDSNIASMMIRLIMQGGRRKPLAPASGGTASSSSEKGKDKVRVMLESKGRRGKQVTCISGLSLTLAELDSLASRLKQSCGTGGTVKDGRIEIQGDNCDRVLSVLAELGYNAKRAGAPSKRR